VPTLASGPFKPAAAAPFLILSSFCPPHCNTCPRNSTPHVFITTTPTTKNVTKKDIIIAAAIRPRRTDIRRMSSNDEKDASSVATTTQKSFFQWNNITKRKRRSQPEKHSNSVPSVDIFVGAAGAVTAGGKTPSAEIIKKRPKRSLLFRKTSSSDVTQPPPRTNSAPLANNTLQGGGNNNNSNIKNNNNGVRAALNASMYQSISESFTVTLQSQQQHQQTNEESDLQHQSDEAESTSSDSDSVPPPLPFPTDRSTSVSLEALRRHNHHNHNHRTSSRTFASCNTSGSRSSEFGGGGGGGVSLNFDKIQSTLFGRADPRQQLWEAYQRVLDRCDDASVDISDEYSGNASDPTKIPATSSSHALDFQTSNQEVTAAVAAEYMNNLTRNRHSTNHSSDSTLRPSTDTSHLHNQNTLETVFIHGRSGVGKSFLLKDFKRRVIQQQSRNVALFLQANHAMPSSSGQMTGRNAVVANSDANMASGRGTVNEPFVAYKDILQQLFAFLLQLHEDPTNKITDEAMKLFAEKLHETLNRTSSFSSWTCPAFCTRNTWT
jgi:hypothetical protein